MSGTIFTSLRTGRLVSMIRLADFLGIHRFLAVVSADTHFPVQLLGNSNPIRNIHACHQSPYWLSVHLLNKRSTWFCARWDSTLTTQSVPHALLQMYCTQTMLDEWELVPHAPQDCSLCHVQFVTRLLSAGVGAQGKLTRSVRPNRFVCCGAVTTSFVKCSSSHRHIQNAECVTAFSTSMAPFIQTFVGLWIIFFARQERDTRESCMIDAIGGKNQIGRKIGKNYRYPTIVHLKWLSCFWRASPLVLLP